MGPLSVSGDEIQDGTDDGRHQDRREEEAPEAHCALSAEVRKDEAEDQI